MASQSRACRGHLRSKKPIARGVLETRGMEKLAYDLGEVRRVVDENTAPTGAIVRSGLALQEEVWHPV